MKLTKGILCRDEGQCSSNSFGNIIFFKTTRRKSIKKIIGGFWFSPTVRCREWTPKEWKEDYDFPTPRKGQCVGEVHVEL